MTLTVTVSVTVINRNETVTGGQVPTESNSPEMTVVFTY